MIFLKYEIFHKPDTTMLSSKIFDVMLLVDLFLNQQLQLSNVLWW